MVADHSARTLEKDTEPTALWKKRTARRGAKGVLGERRSLGTHLPFLSGMSLSRDLKGMRHLKEQHLGKKEQPLQGQQG